MNAFESGLLPIQKRFDPWHMIQKIGLLVDSILVREGTR